MGCSLPGSSIHGVSQARVLEWGALSLVGSCVQPRDWTCISCTGRQALYPVCLVAHSLPTLCNPMDCSPPGPSVHGDSPGNNTGVACHLLLQSIFPTQGSNPGLPHCRHILSWLNHQGESHKRWEKRRKTRESDIYYWNTVNFICVFFPILLFEDNICISTKHSGTYDKVFSRYI